MLGILLSFSSVFASTLDARGDLVFSEFMADTSAGGQVPEYYGEWFEVYNAASREVGLKGLIFKDDGTDTFTITSGINLAPGQYAVLGLNSDTGTNGGVTLTYSYTGFSLGNDDDEIVIVSGGTEIDRVNYLDGPTWPDSKGFSNSLSSDKLNSTANDDLAAWCLAVDSYGAGDHGTPGSANPLCVVAAAR